MKKNLKKGEADLLESTILPEEIAREGETTFFL